MRHDRIVAIFNDYDRYASAYDADIEDNVYNALYERPTTLALAGDVAGRRVLDAGCGSGVLSQALVSAGAAVTGVDVSTNLLAIARNRLGPDVPLIRADLGQQLPIRSSTFDVVVASLVMHYLHDWSGPLTEFRRVLAPGGRVVISTHHPFVDFRPSGQGDYLETFEFTEEWVKSGETFLMRFWHRPLHVMFDAFTAAGFTVERVSEPRPGTAVRDRSPELFEQLSREAPFIFFALRSGDHQPMPARETLSGKMHQLSGEGEQAAGEPHDGQAKRNQEDRHAQYPADEPHDGRDDPQHRADHGRDDSQHHIEQAL
ncbi:Methyltransferase domain-containing protein [Rhodococcus koreensis]|uniref:Methyltransferase domain-containing protein n=1 Tax=Rhodococcus koreensis TaxID=99653 RepID=A0A1H4N9K2_9NOCA|nr:Methyltransferase domain-containing protein [Rhodococcus koreensis]